MTPPKIVPCALVSLGISTTRIAGSLCLSEGVRFGVVICQSLALRRGTVKGAETIADCYRMVMHFKPARSEEHTSELQSRLHLVCRLLLEKKNQNGHPRDALRLLIGAVRGSS